MSSWDLDQRIQLYIGEVFWEEMLFPFVWHCCMWRVLLKTATILGRNYCRTSYSCWTLRKETVLCSRRLTFTLGCHGICWEILGRCSSMHHTPGRERTNQIPVWPSSLNLPSSRLKAFPCKTIYAENAVLASIFLGSTESDRYILSLGGHWHCQWSSYLVKDSFTQWQLAVRTFVRRFGHISCY